MKKLCMRMAALMFAVVLTLTSTGTVFAAELQCSLTVRLTDLKTTLGGVGVTVYQVGELKSQDNLQVFLPVKGLEDMSAAFTADNLNHADSARKAAQELAGNIDSLGIKGRTVNTDAAGTAVFSNLNPGIYLVKQTSGEEEYGVIQPFLAVLPYLDAATGELLYQMEASPKAEAPAKEPETEAPTEESTTEAPTEEPETESETENKNRGTNPSGNSGRSGINDSETPKTGDNSPLMLWGILFGLSLAVIAAAAAAKKKFGKR